MYDLTTFSLKDMTTCGAALRKMGDEADSLEEVAESVVRYLFDQLVDDSGERTSVLVRGFITTPYQNLDVDHQKHVQKLLGRPPVDPEVRCQTLLATIGVNPQWNDRRNSAYYKVLPLTEQIVNDNPMFAQVSEVFGIMLERTVRQDKDFLAEHERETYNVFHVPDALGNEFVPAQVDFVVPYDIRSVLGFYGMLPSRNLFTFVLFSRARIPQDTVAYFKILALNVKMALLPFDEKPIFAAGPSNTSEKSDKLQQSMLQPLTSSLSHLISVQEDTVIQQSERINKMVTEMRQQTRDLTETNKALTSEIAENERLRQQAADAAVLQERNRLARDLHDSVTQAIYSQTLYAEAARRQLDSGELALAADHLGQLQETAQQALREMRLLIFELRPSALETEGFAAALHTRLEVVEARSGIGTEISINGPLQLQPEIETELYWIAQEALNNSLKHAQASWVSISLTQEKDQYVLKIEDDGQGFDLFEASMRGGLGLHSMRERAEKLGGQVIVNSHPGTGTVVQVEVHHV